MNDQGPIRLYGWNWGRDEDSRPQIPWIGVFLVILGGLLVLKQIPGYGNIGDVVILAAGLAFLVIWLIRRSTFALYAGALLTAAAVPGVVEGISAYSPGAGFGTLCYGVAFLFIALVRAVSRGGWGWQLIVGLVLLALGASELAVPNLGSVTLPLLLIVLGVVLVTRRR